MWNEDNFQENIRVQKNKSNGEIEPVALEQTSKFVDGRGGGEVSRRRERERRTYKIQISYQ
jgi:hypothetical protein